MLANKKVKESELKIGEVSERYVGPIFDNIFKHIKFKIVL